MDFQNQQMLEHLFDKHQAHPLIQQELDGNTQLQDQIRQAVERSQGVLTAAFITDVLVHLVQAKRATVPALVSLFRFHYSERPEPTQFTAMALAGLIALQLAYWDADRHQVVIRHDVSERTHTLIKQYMYLPPMIVPPLEVRDDGRNRGSGYTTKPNDSLLLQDNHHEGDLYVQHLNRVNQVGLTINAEVVTTIRNEWRDLEAPKPNETFEDYKKRIKAFEQYEAYSFMVMALMIEMGNRFHLTHKYDKRGRTYCQGYHVDYQGTPWNKAVVELANPLPIRS